MDIRAPKTGDSDFEVTTEEKNEHDKFVASIYHDKTGPATPGGQGAMAPPLFSGQNF